MARRVEFIDYGKAVTIIAVVLHHVGCSAMKHIGLFAMPLFFLTSGHFYERGRRTFKEHAKHLFRHLIIPYWGLSLLAIAVEMVRAPYFGYGTPEVALPGLITAAWGSGYAPNPGGIFDPVLQILTLKIGKQVPGCADLILPCTSLLWFLPVMFAGGLLFWLLSEKVGNRKLRICLTLLLLVVSGLEQVFPILCQLPYGIGRAPLAAAFMMVGYETHRLGVFEWVGRKRALTLLICLGLSAAGLFLGVEVQMVRSYYGPFGLLSVYPSFVCCAAAAVFVLYLMRLLEGVGLRRLGGALAFVGRHTMAVYGYHMIVLFPLSVLYLQVTGATPVLDTYAMTMLPADMQLLMYIGGAAAIVICLIPGMVKEHRAALRA